MSEYRARIDQVLVHLFNDILRIEEESLHRRGVHGLSMREIHVLQAIMESGEENTMSAVAARLHVTVGSLTVAINTLVRKGYVGGNAPARISGAFICCSPPAPPTSTGCTRISTASSPMRCCGKFPRNAWP